MAANGSYSLSISAVDKTAAAFSQVNKRFADMHSRLAKPFANLSQSVKGVSDLTKGIGGVDRTLKGFVTGGVSQFGKLGSSASGVADSISRILPVMGTLTTLLSIGGISHALQQYGDWGVSLDRIARIAGTSAVSLANWQNAARLAGASAGDISSSFASLSSALLDVRNGVGEAGMMGRLLGLNGTESVDQAFGKIMEALQKYRNNPALQRRIMAAFGISENLLRMNESGGIQAWLRQAIAATGGGVTQEQINNAVALGDAYNKLAVAVEAAGIKIMSAIGPTATQAINEIVTSLAGLGPKLTAFGNDPAWQQIKLFFGVLSDTIFRVGDGIGHTLRAVYDNRHYVTDVADEINAKFAWLRDQLMGFWDAILGKISDVVDKVVGLLEKIGAAVHAITSTPFQVPLTNEQNQRLNPMQALPNDGYGVDGKPLAQKSAYRVGQDYSTRPTEVSSTVTATLAYLEGSSAFASWVSGKFGNGSGNGGGGSGNGGGGGGGTSLASYTPFGSTGSNGDANGPRGIRNNNPLNLQYRSDQPGVTGSDGRFGKYGSMQDGVASALRQMKIYQSQGVRTLAQIIGKWAPPSENNTGKYVSEVSAQTGLKPDADVNLNDSATASALIAAMARHENGRPIDPNVIRQGVERALGLNNGGGQNQGSSAPGMQANNGSIDVTVHHDSSGRLPPGTTQVAANGAMFGSGQGMVSQSMPMFASL